jgi:malic enzyme
MFRGEFNPFTVRWSTANNPSTGSVILGGFIRAAKMASDASGRDPREHKVVFLGGGSAAVG